MIGIGTKEKVLLATSILLWFLLNGLLLAPGLGGTDIYFFKDAGANLALGRGLTSVLTFGNPTFDPRVNAHYPPVYGIAFAAFCKLFGIGPLQNTLHNLTIATVTTTCAYLAFRQESRGGDHRIYDAAILALTCAAMPMAFYGAEADRPDAMGLAAAICALLAASATSALSRYFLAFLLAGFAFETSPICGVFAVAGLGILWLSRTDPKARRLASLRQLIPVAAAGFIICPVLFQGILAAFDPSSAERLIGVILGTNTDNSTGGGYLLALLHGNFRLFLSAYRITTFEHAAQYMKLAVVSAAILGYALLPTTRKRAVRDTVVILLIIAIGLLPVLLVPYQSNYAGVSAGFTLILFSIVIASKDRAGRFAVIIAYMGIVAASAPTTARELLYRTHLGASLDRMTATLLQLEARPELHGETIAVSPESYMLFKQLGYDVVVWSSPVLTEETRSKIPLYAFAYNGSGNPMQPRYPDWWQARDYKLLFEPQLPQTVKVFGIPVSRSSVTWEVAIYERRAANEH